MCFGVNKQLGAVAATRFPKPTRQNDDTLHHHTRFEYNAEGLLEISRRTTCVQFAFRSKLLFGLGKMWVGAKASRKFLECVYVGPTVNNVIMSRT